MHDDIEKILGAVGGPFLDDKRAYLVELIGGMLTRPSIPGRGHGDPLTVEAVIDRIQAAHLSDFDYPLCWIRRDGFVMPAVNFEHEYVLNWLGVDSRHVEDQGWVRLSNSGWQCMYRVTYAQQRALKKRGHEVDMQEERLKKTWHGLPPFDPSIHPSRRVRGL
jgi:hypothetical protein